MTLSELRLLCERATKGTTSGIEYNDDDMQWFVLIPNTAYPDETMPIAYFDHERDAQFYAAARTWLQALIEALAACDHLVCPTDHHTLGCLCSCAECDRRRAAVARLAEMK